VFSASDDERYALIGRRTTTFDIARMRGWGPKFVNVGRAHEATSVMALPLLQIEIVFDVVFRIGPVSISRLMKPEHSRKQKV